jgi:methylated-DNA-[protein]-cysteine S-methyltransferase
MSQAIIYQDSPVGLLEICGEDEWITAVNFADTAQKEIISSPVVVKCALQLAEYFTGKRKAFDLPLQPDGTEFQQKVWKQLQLIPFGETISYHTLAMRLGDPKATRAVGLANGKNLISIIVPCHRVIGASGKLTGYAGGLWRKKWLLNHENSFMENDLFNSVA